MIVLRFKVNVYGYGIVRRNRPLGGRNEGGVCFYIRFTINYNIRTDFELERVESLSVEISKPRSRSIIVTTWYRPPNSLRELFSDFETLVGKLDAEGKEYFVMGDFNCNMLSSSLNNTNTQALLNITNIYNLKQLINEPTRITPMSSALIDV